MIVRLLKHLSSIPILFPRTVIIVSLVLTLASVVFIPRLHVTTDRNLLAGTDNPVFKTREKISEMFGTSFVGIVILEGNEDRSQLQKAADAVSAAISTRDDLVREVFYRADVDFFKQHALLFLEPDQIEQLRSLMEQLPAPLETIADGGQLSDLVVDLAEGMESISAPDESADEGAGDKLKKAESFFGQIEQWFTGPPREPGEFSEQFSFNFFSRGTRLNTDGYLTENDDKAPHLAILFVQPASTSQSIEVVAPFTDFLRGETRRVLEGNPEITSYVTGLPAMSRDEMLTIRTDSLIAGLIAGIGVFAVFMIAFRSFRIGLFLFAPLGIGLVWTTGFAAFAYGYLTMITAYFAAILFGLGVAFTIHIMARFHEALRAGEDVPSAVRTSVIKAGPGVLVGGGTTAFAFWAIILSDFKGFAEMGVISGIGIAFILIANVTVLPAALVLWHPGKSLLPPRTSLRSSMALWMKVAHSRIMLPALALIAAVLGVASARQIDFDYALENMLPSAAESVKGLEILNQRTDFTSTYSVAVADSIEEAERLRLEFSELSTVDRAGALSQFIPADQSARLREIELTRKACEEPITRASAALTNYVPASSRLTAAALADSFQTLADTVEDLAFAAKRAGREESTSLQSLKSSIRGAEKAIRASNSDERAVALEAGIFSQARKGLGVLASSLGTRGFGPGDLPESMRRRFISRDGEHFAVFVHPNGDTGDGTFLDRHVNELYSVSDFVAGHAVGNYHFSEMIISGFKKAVILAALAVVLLVLLDIRSVKGLTLALLPVAFGAGWTALFMALTDFKLNYANLMALPILIGTGVDYGVHLAHRAKQEGSVLQAARTTGKAIALSGLTTLIGFGSLIPSTHWGMRSLGLLLVFGITSALFVALVVLPGFFSIWERR